MDHRDQFNLCWCCQIAQGSDGLWVDLDNDLPIPVCRKCWKELPPADRVRLAIQFRDRGDGGAGLAQAIEALIETLRGAGRLPMDAFLDGSDN